MRLHASCTGTLRESALKVDFGRIIQCRTWKSNLRRRRVGPMLYQLSDIPTPWRLVFANDLGFSLPEVWCSRWSWLFFEWSLVFTMNVAVLWMMLGGHDEFCCSLNEVWWSRLPRLPCTWSMVFTITLAVHCIKSGVHDELGCPLHEIWCSQ